MKSLVFICLKADFLQAVGGHAIRPVDGAVQALDPRRSPVHDANEFRAKFRRAVFEQSALGLVRGKPAWISIRFLRRFEARYFAKVSSDSEFCLEFRIGRSSRGRRDDLRGGRVVGAPKITSESDGLDLAVNAGLFKCFEGRRLGMGKARFNSTFGENPASAASLHQQKFEAVSADAVTDRGDLLALSGEL